MFCSIVSPCIASTAAVVAIILIFVVITNTNYWMGADVTVGVAKQGRVRDRGRVWDFEGRSAEICQISWGSAA